MKKNYLFAVALGATMLASCSQEEQLGFTDEAKSGFTGVMETVDSRTTLDDDNNVCWAVNKDTVSIFEMDDQNTKYVVSSVSNGIAYFSFVDYTANTSPATLEYNYAVYPYDDNNSISSEGVISAPVSATIENYSGKNDAVAKALMVAKSSTTDLSFTNAQGFLLLRLNAQKPTNYGGIKSIKIASTSHNLAGTATMSWSSDTDKPEAKITNGTKELTITLASDLQSDNLPKSADGEYTEYYIPMVPTTFEAGDAKMIITWADDTTYEVTIGIAFEVGRNRIKPLKHTVGSQNWTGTTEGTVSVWDGSTITTPSTETDEDGNTYYVVNTGSELAGLAALVNGTAQTALSVRSTDSYDFKLTGDIDLGGKEWTPIGNGSRKGNTSEGNAYTGVFDGCGYTIKGLSITSGSANDAVGLFGVVNGGTIKNVKLTDVNIKVSDNELAGAAAGFVTGGGVVDGVTVAGEITANRGVGGVVGRATVKATISNCENSATINATAGNAGGVIGAAYYTATGNEYKGTNAALVIKNCKNSGKVTTSAGGYTGGIVGLSSASVTGCENTGAVEGSSTSVGGIVGEQKEAGEVTGCTNSGTVTNKGDKKVYGAGGIIGWVRYPASEAGSGNPFEVQNIIEVKNNINKAAVSGASDAGGIIGAVYNYAVVTNNENSAATLSAKNFAAGIVGNVQFEGANVITGKDYTVTITDNVSTTEYLKITATNKSAYAYDNSQGEYATIARNTGCPIVVTTTAEAQAALDQAEEGTIIYLTSNVEYGALSIRPTKNSNTTYKCDQHSEYTDATAFIAHLAESGYHGTPAYTTTLKNVTIVGAEGATIAGFTASSGHYYGDVYDYVRDINYTVGSAYYFTLNITGLTFQNVAFTGKVNLNTSLDSSVYDGVTFEGCTFTTGGTESTNGAAIRYYNENNNGNIKNIKVDDCDFTNCYQGVYVHHVNGITVTDCEFNTTGHNAIAMQNTSEAVALKNVVITGNTFTNIGDRIIRFGDIAADSNITIQSNTATNSGDEDDQVMKASTIETGVTTSIKNNNWGENTKVANKELEDEEE